MIGPSLDDNYQIELNVKMNFFQVMKLRKIADSASPSVSAAINEAIAKTDWWEEYKKFPNLRKIEAKI